MSFNFDEPLTISDVLNAGILLVTIIAIIIGPIIALRISRSQQALAEKRRRQLEIFTTLIRTRRAELSPDRVMALNSIPVEFYNIGSIISAHENYLKQLNTEFPAPDAPNSDAFHKELSDLMYDLLYAVGKYLDFQFDKRDLEKFAYSPVGWTNDDSEQRRLRRALIDVLSGSRPLTVSNIESQPQPQSGKFPPKP